MKIFLPLAAIVLGLALSGCDTFDRRAQQKSATFESLAPAEREKLRQGVIELGNTPDMVYIALGKADETRDKVTPNGRETIWIYNSYQLNYEGSLFSGYHRVLVYDARARGYVIYHVPVYTEAYSEHTEETIRVKFQDERVVQIEQPVRRTKGAGSDAGGSKASP